MTKTEMRILTVRQPWAWAIIHGGKDVENRVRNIAGDYRGPVAIHVAQAEDSNAFSLSSTRDAANKAADEWMAEAVRLRPKSVETVPWAKGYGYIIGTVDLVDVHGCSTISGCIDSNDRSDMRRIICSPWAEVHGTHMVLANPRPLATPIPYRGALGLRRLDEETTAQILAQIGEQP